MLRIALIGCGEHSQIAHAGPLGRLAKERPNDIKLVATCDLSLERAQDFATRYGFAKAYTDWEKMIEAEKPDACVAVMPVSLTAAFAEKLLRRKMPCVIEKPMGSNIEEVRRLAEVVKETGTPHIVSVNRRFLPHLNKARAWVKEQGELRFVSATMLRVKRDEPEFVWGTGMHVVDGLRHIVGDVRDITTASNGKRPASNDWYSAAFRFGQDGMGALHVLPTCGSADEVYELMGEGFRAQVTTKQTGITTIKCWRGDKLVVDEGTAPNEEPFVFRGEYAETIEFIEALQNKRHPRPSVLDVLPSAELCARLLSRT
jgi:predicted dehydrogenase